MMVAPIFSSPSSVLMSFVDRRSAAHQRNAAARDDALFDGRAGCVHRILDARLLLLHLGLGCSADLDDGNAANQLGQPLLQLLAVVVGGGLLDLRANLLHAALDLAVLAAAVDDGGVVLVDGDALGGAQVLDLDALKLDAEVFGDRLAAREDGDVLQHCLAAIAEARSLHRRDVQRAAQLVDHQGRQRLAVHILGDDDERLRGAGNRSSSGSRSFIDEIFFS